MTEEKPAQMHPEARPPVAEFRNVTKIFNQGTRAEFCALDRVNFCVQDLPAVGEFIAMLGPSGCGKSTVLNLMAGFKEVFPPSSGEVLVRGAPISGPGFDRGMVFQKYSSFPHLTVLQNVKFGLELNRQTLGLSEAEIDSRAKEWTVKVGLERHINKYPHQLSGGQQQRVAIARTLALKTRIILMDEAFSALDEPTRLEMQQLLVDLWQEVEATVFMVTHSISEAVYLGDRIWIFTPSPGRIAKEFPNIPRATPGKPALEMLKTKEFQASVDEVSAAFTKIERGEPL
jgi:NitT/TauT family transport system ATP-binding protein